MVNKLEGPALAGLCCRARTEASFVWGRSLFRLMGRTFGIATQRSPSIESRLRCGLANPRCRLGIGPNVDPFALPLHAALAEKEPALKKPARSLSRIICWPDAVRGNVATTRFEIERRASGIDLEQWLRLSECLGCVRHDTPRRPKCNTQQLYNSPLAHAA